MEGCAVREKGGGSSEAGLLGYSARTARALENRMGYSAGRTRTLETGDAGLFRRDVIDGGCGWVL